MQFDRLVTRILLGSACALVVACGSDSSPGDDDDDDMSSVDAGDDRADANIPDGSFTVEWGPVDVAPGEEDTRCIVAELDNTEPIQVNQIYNYLGEVSHHFIVYKAAPNETVNTTPFDCNPFTGTLGGADSATPLAITQRFEETLTLPDGVGFVFEAHQKVRLELHYINASDTMKTVQASATFTPMAEGEFQDAAGFLFAGDVNISIPPMSSHTLGPTYIPLPPDLIGVNFFALTGHVHERGTDVTLELSQGDTAGEVVYDLPTFDWDEPETVRYEPELVPPANSGFRITCEWYNDTNRTVSFGESANEEMCFFWGYYYPDQGSRVCFAHSGLGITDCCPGGSFCDSLGF